MGRYKVAPKTRAGVDWHGESIFAAAKISSYHAVAQFVGGDIKELMGRTWRSPTNFFGINNQRKLADKVCNILEGFADAYRLVSTHKGSLGRVLLGRGVFCISKQEILPFKQQWFSPFYQGVTKEFIAGNTITEEKRFQWHEKVILNCGDCPGVYVNVNPTDESWCYLGCAKSTKDRHKGHVNSNWCLLRIYATYNRETAERLEKALFQQLERSGLVVEQKINGSMGRCGAIRIKGNSLAVIDNLVKSYYRPFCKSFITGVGPKHICITSTP